MNSKISNRRIIQHPTKTHLSWINFQSQVSFDFLNIFILFFIFADNFRKSDSVILLGLTLNKQTNKLLLGLSHCLAVPLCLTLTSKLLLGCPLLDWLDYTLEFHSISDLITSSASTLKIVSFLSSRRTIWPQVRFQNIYIF